MKLLIFKERLNFLREKDETILFFFTHADSADRVKCATYATIK